LVLPPLAPPAAQSQGSAVAAQPTMNPLVPPPVGAPVAQLPPVGSPAGQLPIMVLPPEPAPPVETKPAAVCENGDEPKIPFKWSWGGQFRVEPNSANFPFQPLVITNDEHTETFVQQRMRLWATINPNDNVEGYIQMQIGGVLWGQNVDFPKTFDGPKF